MPPTPLSGSAGPSWPIWPTWRPTSNTNGTRGSSRSVVLAGTGPYPAAEVADTLGVTVLGHLPADPAGAAALWAGGGRTWAHSPLGRATKDLAAALAERADTTDGSDAPARGGADDGGFGAEDRGEAIAGRNRDAVGVSGNGTGPLTAPSVGQRDGLVDRLRTEVARRLSETATTDGTTPDLSYGPLADGDRAVLGRALIAEALQEEATAALRAGRPVLDPDTEDAIAAEVFACLFAMAGFQPYLEDVSIENINANGADEVFVRYADGTREQVAPVASSDNELVELVRTLAARVGLGERRFDLASPRLSLQLPDGSRLFAVMAVTGRPCVSIRRHRFLKITLSDLVGHRHPRCRVASVPRRLRVCPQEPARHRGHRGRQDHHVASPVCRDPSRRTLGHHRGLPRTGPRSGSRSPS